METRIEHLEEACDLMNLRLDQFQQALERFILQLHPTNTSDQSAIRESNGKVGRQSDGKNKLQYARIDFPCFDGRDPLAFKYKSEQFFLLHQTAKMEKAFLASFHMDGVAWT